MNKKIISIMILAIILMSVSVSAVESWETTDDDWILKGENIVITGEFGDEPSFLEKLFGSSELSFTSDIGIPLNFSSISIFLLLWILEDKREQLSTQ